jgi:hypothetical protein
VHEIGGSAALLQSANEHGNVRSLAAPVSVQFVEDQEAQAPASSVQKALILRPHQQEFRHHVVGEQDLWRASAQCLAYCLVGLARIFSECHWEGLAGAALVVLFELLQCLEL